MTQSPHDARQHAPATERNRDPILKVLQSLLPPTGTVLEIASGTGEHGVYFAPRLQPRRWLPTDVSPIACASIAAWREQVRPQGLSAPLTLDVRDPVWPVELSVQSEENLADITAIVAINMIHIAPWAAGLGLLAGAERVLPTGGMLYLYGPFQRQGSHTAPSNAAFDASLQAQDPEWGVRHLEDVVAAAAAHQLHLSSVVEMPANNLSVVFRRA
ncbi:MAG: DUF938 domain-containing protein [Synechococcaceae cyanobacterium RM1_1_27]|nr:DUF938 domain-containing protein [Synechococcaceae cyanobacterium SM2_3_2]NJO85640.1 DUF938 domain-containing protein [Synechococcaceae cyanobacterium RM1_1_27]